MIKCKEISCLDRKIQKMKCIVKLLKSFYVEIVDKCTFHKLHYLGAIGKDVRVDVYVESCHKCTVKMCKCTAL